MQVSSANGPLGSVIRCEKLVEDLRSDRVITEKEGKYDGEEGGGGRTYERSTM